MADISMQNSRQNKQSAPFHQSGFAPGGAGKTCSCCRCGGVVIDFRQVFTGEAGNKGRYLRENSVVAGLFRPSTPRVQVRCTCGEVEEGGVGWGGGGSWGGWVQTPAGRFGW